MWLWKSKKLQSAVIRPSVVFDEGEPDSIQLELIVDGVVLPAFEYGPLDLKQIEDGLLADGTFFFWTCWCGYPGCAGNNNGVAVRHHDPTVEWRDRDMKKRYFFREDDLRRSFDNAVAHGQRLLQDRPELVVLPTQNLAYFRTSPV